MEGRKCDCSCVIVMSLLDSQAATFNIGHAVCNHGFFMMAPNRWNPSTKTLERPLRLSNSTTSVLVSISSSDNNKYLSIQVHGIHHLSYKDRQTIQTQVKRMLRISEKDEKDVQEFQKMHDQAKNRGFGRIFRSSSLFEDIVKSALLCNCGWVRTLKMVETLCELQKELTSAKTGPKRKRSKDDKVNKINCELSNSLGNFPNAKELVALGQSSLESHCKMGYRGCTIIEFAKDFETTKLKLIKGFKDSDVSDTKSYNTLHRKLIEVKGFGPFTCANILMCCGFYQKIPVDSETIRHLLEFHHHDVNKNRTKKPVEKVYGKYKPFQCLAYWLELLECYEVKVQCSLSELPSSRYVEVTGSNAKQN